MHVPRFAAWLGFFWLAAQESAPAAPFRPAPPPGIRIAEEDRAKLERGAQELASEIASLRRRAPTDSRIESLLPDVEIFHKAVDWALRYDEFFRSNEVSLARPLLDYGMKRAQRLAQRDPFWLTSTGLVVRGFRSKIDDSVQPYGLVVPASFAQSTNRPHRLDVWLHGRDNHLTELKFISERLRSYGEFTPPDTFVLHPYGRYCNAFKFAGETDVFEALEHAKKSYPIDELRIGLRGFSMGGAGVWHLAAHHPSAWAAAAPGAGFAETAEYTGALRKEPKPTWWEQKLWKLYDATEYAANFHNLPVIAYSGELDKQKQAADVMARAMKAEGLELEHIIGPKTEHKYEPGTKRELERRFDELMTKGREEMPTRLRLTTHSLRYSQAAWITVERLEHHWQKARVDADLWEGTKLDVKTANVEALSFDFGKAPLMKMPETIVLDGKRFGTSTLFATNAGFSRVGAVRSNGAWSVRPVMSVFFPPNIPGSRWQQKQGPKYAFQEDDYAAVHSRPFRVSQKAPLPVKAPGLQGPIDDAFIDSFVVVRPTQKAHGTNIGAWTEAELARFTNEWRAQFRGDVRISDADGAEAGGVANSGGHLILWGDPTSNPVIAKLLPKLPLQWDAKEIRFGTNRFDAATHVPVLIFPNPLNPSRYVVLNSGPTFFDFGAASNAQQTPKLPDFAVIDITVARAERLTRGVVLAGFFDEQWRLPEGPQP